MDKLHCKGNLFISDNKINKKKRTKADHSLTMQTKMIAFVPASFIKGSNLPPLNFGCSTVCESILASFFLPPSNSRGVKTNAAHFSFRGNNIGHTIIILACRTTRKRLYFANKTFPMFKGRSCFEFLVPFEGQ